MNEGFPEQDRNALERSSALERVIVRGRLMLFGASRSVKQSNRLFEKQPLQGRVDDLSTHADVSAETDRIVESPEGRDLVSELEELTPDIKKRITGGKRAEDRLDDWGISTDKKLPAS